MKSADPDCFLREASFCVWHVFDGKKRERRNVTIGGEMVTNRGLTMVSNVTKVFGDTAFELSRCLTDV